ncbi:hypothetical protein SC206_18705 [Rouxiella sp. T17]|uniref:hypothetical protein n=1 Tax=Rouxiella sp. T17 TaxID=3085684 RepID=UPI002FC7E0F2
MGIYLSANYRKQKSKLVVTSLFTVFVMSWTSSAFAAPATVIAGNWSEEQAESRSDFTCPANQVIVSREHTGDENGRTRYKCATVSQDGKAFTTKDAQWSESIKESAGTYYQCPESSPVMTGRKHSGDENGNTLYQCSTLINASGQTVKVTDGKWSENLQENHSSFECPANTVMIGREHSGDENGNTKYYCGQVN